MTFAAYITVISNTGQAIPGATVTLRSVRAITDSSGSATLYFKDGDVGQTSTLTATAVGYADASQLVTLPTLSLTVTTLNISVIVPMVPAVSSLNIPVLVRDANTQKPISGAQVCAGAQPPLATDSSGQVQLIVSGSSIQITVSAAGYNDSSQNSLGPGALVFDMQATVGAVRSVQIFVSPQDGTPAPTAGASVALQDGLLAENYQVGPDGSFVTAATHKTGSLLNVTVTSAAYQTLVTTLLLDSRTVYVIGPLTASSGNADAGQPVDPGQIQPVADTITNNVVPSNLVRPPDNYEYVYPAGDFGKYFTTSQARMYIGNIFVDELHTVQFALQANKIPIYGYASRDYDAMALGKALVQGQIFINFISEGYLYTIVKEHSKLQQDLRDSDNPNSDAQKQFASAAAQAAVLVAGQPVFAGNKPSPGSNPDGSPQPAGGQRDVRLQLVEQKMAQLAALGPSVLDGGRFSQSTTTFANACYLPFPFDIEVELEGAGRVVKRRLEKVHLGSNEQVMDQSGEVIGETYSFLARRLR